MTHNIGRICSDWGFQLADVAKTQAFNDLAIFRSFPEVRGIDGAVCPSNGNVRGARSLPHGPGSRREKSPEVIEGGGSRRGSPQRSRSSATREGDG